MLYSVKKLNYFASSSNPRKNTLINNQRINTFDNVNPKAIVHNVLLMYEGINSQTIIVKIVNRHNVADNEK